VKRDFRRFTTTLRNISSSFDSFIILFSIVLLRAYIPFPWFPQLLIRLGTITIFLISIICSICQLVKLQFIKISYNPIILFLISIFGILISRAFISSINSGVVSIIDTLFHWMSILGVIICIYLIRIKPQKSYSTKYLFTVFLYGLVVYIFVNCIAYFLGVDQLNKYYRFYPTIMLQKIGIYSYRTLFSTASGINSFGVLGGAIIVIGTLFLILEKKRFPKIIGVFTIIMGIFVILKTDSRGPLIYAICVILFSIVPKINTFLYLRLFSFLTPFYAIFLVIGVKLIPIKFLNSINRFNPQNGIDSILSGRMEIWNSYIEYFRNFQPMHLLGSGFMGQQISGVSSNYSHLFLSWSIPEVNGAHNLALQTTIETGYLGLIIILSLINLTLYYLHASYNLSNANEIRISFFLIIYFLIAGATESVFTLDNSETLYILIIVAILAGAIKLENKEYLISPNPPQSF
jgi:O-antigen ligase